MSNNSITASDVVAMVHNGKVNADEAIEVAKRLGLDHREIAAFFSVKLPEEIPEESLPRTYRVTARAVPFTLPDGRQLPWLSAGRHRWSRAAGGAGTTNELCDSQYYDVLRKVEQSQLFITQEEQIPQPSQPEKSKK